MPERKAGAEDPSLGRPSARSCDRLPFPDFLTRDHATDREEPGRSTSSRFAALISMNVAGRVLAQRQPSSSATWEREVFSLWPGPQRPGPLVAR
jgi:hypothetical protein